MDAKLSVIHPSPDVFAVRLDEAGMGRGRASVAAPARAAGFTVELFGAIGFLPPTWRRANPDDEHTSYIARRIFSYRLVGYKRFSAGFGLQAFDCLWTPTGAPTVRLLYVGWPWRMGNVTELVRILKTTP